MSEAIDFYKDLKQINAEKRASNREASASILSKSGIIFDQRNCGAHLIVMAGAKTVDFWPGTGLWIVRGTSERRRGVRTLVTFVERQRTAS